MQKRKAIQEALQPFMDASLLAETLGVWEEKYSHLPTFALQHFLHEICQHKLLLAQRSKMLQALIRSLSALPDDVLESSKKNAPPQKAAVYVQKEKGQSPELSMFIDLVEGLIAFSSRDIPEKIRLYVMENLPKADIDTENRWAIHAWLDEERQLKEIALDIRSMQQVINLVYIALCEYLGPVKADAVLNTVLASVQKKYPSLSANKLL